MPRRTLYTVHVPEGSEPPNQQTLDNMVGKAARYNGIVTGVIKTAWTEEIDGKHRICFEAESDPGQQ